MKRALAAVLALTTALLSCTTQPPPPPDQSGCALTIATGADQSGGTRQELLKAWNAENRLMQACFEVIAGTTDDQHSEMRAAAQAGSDRFDVYNLDIQAIPGFAAAGHLVPIDLSQHIDVGDFFDNVLDAGKWDGIQFAVPFNTDAGLLYSHLDAGSTAPASWGELRQIIAQRTLAPLQFAGQFASYEGLFVNALEIIRAHGGEIADDEGEVMLGRKEGLAGIQALIDAVRSPRMIPRHVLEYTEDQAMQEFGTGRVLFMRNWPYAYRELSDNGFTTMRVTNLPWKSVLGGQYLAVSAHSRNQDKAQELIKALTGSDQSATLYKCGGFAPARESGFTGNALPCPVTEEPRRGSEHRVPGGLLKKAIEEALPRPKTPYYLEFSRTFHTALHRLLVCHADDPPKTCPITAEKFVHDLIPRLEESLTGR